MPRFIKFLALLFASFLLLTLVVFPQILPVSLLYQKDGGAAGAQLGYSVAGAGDVNGDGCRDFIIGAPFASPGGLASAGSAFVFSGSDGSLLYQKDGGAAGDHLGYSVASTGDVDGDAKADFIVGAPLTDPWMEDVGSAYIYSGATGALLIQTGGDQGSSQFGYQVAGIGDVNGDGKGDFIVGAPRRAHDFYPDGGAAYVFSGNDGGLLYSYGGINRGDWFGKSVAGTGDINGDGTPDFIVGVPGADSAYPHLDLGAAHVYSGSDGALLITKRGKAAYDDLGYSVAGAGDVNGDGRADIIVGAIFADPGGIDLAGSAYVYSGMDGSLLFQKNGGAAGDWLGYCVAGAGDANGDGRSDFIVAAPDADPGGLWEAGSAYLYSGADGFLLYQKDGAAASDQLGCSAASTGDVDGDGCSDFIIGAPYANPGEISDAGCALVYALVPTSVTREERGGIPIQFELGQNFPNPFNATTQILFDLPAQSGSGERSVRLEVFNLLGQKVATLIDEPLIAGHYRVNWDAKDDQGRALSSGVYLYRLEAPDFKATKRMLLLK